MSARHTINGHKITLEKKGGSSYAKLSYPIHSGIFTELENNEYVLQFNRNQEILRAKMKGSDWPHPNEWLKRTAANDWIYYSNGGYTGVFEATGEYYLPNFDYPTNNILGGHPFQLPEVKGLTTSWYPALQQFARELTGVTPQVDIFFEKALLNTPEVLARKADRLHDIISGPISVLPPDARHVDYNVIPLPISRGCLYKCRFCKVKNHQPFTALPTLEISHSIEQLAAHYNRDLINYNAVFLGDHDGLQAGTQHISEAINLALDMLHLDTNHCPGAHFFLFGSVGSFLDAPENLFQYLNTLPGLTCINIGLESNDQATLDRLGKPIKVREVREAFARLVEVNNRYNRIEITANFIMDNDLPDNHYSSILCLIRDSQPHTRPKGSIYFSSLAFDEPSRAKLFEFNRLKVLSRFPTFLYIIQRL